MISSASAVTLPSFFDEPCSMGNPTSIAICEGVNAINDALEGVQANVTSIDTRLTTAESHINGHHLGTEVIALDNDQRLDDILFNSTSINATSFVKVDAVQQIQNIDISSLESSVSTQQSQISSLQSTTTTQQSEIDAIHEPIDVINRNIAIGPLPVPQLETDYTAICNAGSQTKIPGSGIGTLTNGVNTTSNIPELIVGTIANVTVDYTDTRLTFKMTVTNPDDITGLTGEAFLTCVTYPN